jgi:hypothetical protein
MCTVTVAIVFVIATLLGGLCNYLMHKPHGPTSGDPNLARTRAIEIHQPSSEQRSSGTPLASPSP